jgi:hypothetical protein
MLGVLQPLHFLSLLSRDKSFDNGTLLGHPRLNALGLHATRVELAHRVNRLRRRRLAAALPALTREAFDRDGHVVIRDFLPPPVFRALLAQVHALRTDVRERREGSTLLRKIPVNAPLLAQVPALDHLLTEPRFRALLAYGEGSATPPTVYLQTVVQQPASGGRDPQCDLHRDTFHPSVKAWLYLTDVPVEAGPLTYVTGSHALPPARLAWEHAQSVRAAAEQGRGSFRVSEEDLATMGYPPPTPLAVPANTLVVADTFGFHARGVSQGPALRMEVWAIGRRAPFLSARSESVLGWLLGRRLRNIWQQRSGSALEGDPG